MVKIERIRDTRYAGGEKWIKADLQVSTAADLPELGENIDGAGKTDAGTVAQDIQDGKFYTLDADGGWYDDDGNEPEDT